MDGVFVGVFGSDPESNFRLEASVAKKAEAEGIAVYNRTEGGRRISFLDTPDYPGRVQGYSSIASISDHAVYIFPKSGRLAASDGELAVLLSAFGVPGTMMIFDSTATPDSARSALRGTAVADFRIEERQTGASAIDLPAAPRPDLSTKGTLIYVDRAFTVKGVGTVALGFVLSGSVKVHDQLRLIPGPSGLRADVKGIQINDVDHDSSGRGIRVGLSLRGVDPADLQRTHWLDDGSFQTSDALTFEVSRSPFYKQALEDRDMHLQLPGEILPARLTPGPNGSVTAKLAGAAPAWDGMRAAIVDLNGKPLRVAGGATCKL